PGRGSPSSPTGGCRTPPRWRARWNCSGGRSKTLRGCSGAASTCCATSPSTSSTGCGWSPPCAVSPPPRGATAHHERVAHLEEEGAAGLRHLVAALLHQEVGVDEAVRVAEEEHRLRVELVREEQLVGEVA